MHLFLTDFARICKLNIESDKKCVFWGPVKNVQMQGSPRRPTETYLNGTLQGVPTRATPQMGIFHRPYKEFV
jgi:fructose/tagatose bisphosphate aldolase